MKLAILGYGKEGKSTEKYFQNQETEIKIINDFTIDSLKSQDFSDYDIVFRSPSVPPLSQKWSSMTAYFFAHCPCPIIGVTGTKGKGTTCSLITTILEHLGQKTWLVGNIGTPALDVLDQIQATDIVVYEMSSFQLWDLQQSPQIAVVLPIEPDHLNIHHDYCDYVNAKANIAKHQTTADTCIFYRDNPDSKAIADQSKGHKIAYPTTKHRTDLDILLNSLIIKGKHNRENAEAALNAVAAWKNISLNELVTSYREILEKALSSFKGLPHRLEYLRTVNNVEYYDDNFCTNAPSQLVAIEAFPKNNIILIAGGRDKTNNIDIPEIANNILKHKNIRHTILIGESGRELAKVLPTESYKTAPDLTSAVVQAKTKAESISKNNSETTIVLMSPAAASFDMFENVYDRGAQFQKLIKEL